MQTEMAKFFQKNPVGKNTVSTYNIIVLATGVKP